MLILTSIITLGLIQTTGVLPEAANLAEKVGRFFAHTIKDAGILGMF